MQERQQLGHRGLSPFTWLQAMDSAVLVIPRDDWRSMEFLLFVWFTEVQERALRNDWDFQLKTPVLRRTNPESNRERLIVNRSSSVNCFLTHFFSWVGISNQPGGSQDHFIWLPPTDLSRQTNLYSSLNRGGRRAVTPSRTALSMWGDHLSPIPAIQFKLHKRSSGQGFHTVVCAPPPILQLLPHLVNSIQLCTRNTGMRKTLRNHINLFTFNEFCEYLTLGSSILCLTTGLQRQLSRYILPILRRKQGSDTDSLRAYALRNHISEP